jgi:hypothetical protein
MSRSPRAHSHATSLPVGSISGEQRLVFSGAGDLNRALDLGVFYLKAPDGLDLASARQFGLELIPQDSPYRDVPAYGELEGFIALENNQRTKLALRRERWDQHYPIDIAAFGRQLDAVGVAIMREVFHHSGIPEGLWDRASGGYTSG